jgi:hypothetical protein
MNNVDVIYAALVISFEDVYGVELVSSLTFSLYALPLVSKSKRVEEVFEFFVAKEEDARKWVDLIRHILANVPLEGLANIGMCFECSDVSCLNCSVGTYV